MFVGINQNMSGLATSNFPATTMAAEVAQATTADYHPFDALIAEQEAMGTAIVQRIIKTRQKVVEEVKRLLAVVEESPTKEEKVLAAKAVFDYIQANQDDLLLQQQKFRTVTHHKLHELYKVALNDGHDPKCWRAYHTALGFDKDCKDEWPEAAAEE